MMIVASLVAVLQNVLGAGVAYLLGEHPLMGVLAGSVTLTGGPATGLAFAPLFEQAGVSGRGDARRVGGDDRHRLRRTPRWTDRNVSARSASQRTCRRLHREERSRISPSEQFAEPRAVHSRR